MREDCLKQPKYARGSEQIDNAQPYSSNIIGCAHGCYVPNKTCIAPFSRPLVFCYAVYSIHTKLLPQRTLYIGDRNCPQEKRVAVSPTYSLYTESKVIVDQLMGVGCYIANIYALLPTNKQHFPALILYNGIIILYY